MAAMAGEIATALTGIAAKARPIPSSDPFGVERFERSRAKTPQGYTRAFNSVSRELIGLPLTRKICSELVRLPSFVVKHGSCPRLHRLQPTNRRVCKDLRWRDLRNRQQGLGSRLRLGRSPVVILFALRCSSDAWGKRPGGAPRHLIRAL